MAKNEPQKLAELIERITPLVQNTGNESARTGDSNPNSSLIKCIEDQLKTMSQAFGLPASEDTVDAVVTFATEYISSTAGYLSAFATLAEQSDIDSYTHGFLNIAARYFFEPHPIVNSTQDTEALLCQAYLCHRTLEELNDRILAERQWPLAPCDNAHANLLAHTIIGDERANLLDQTVLINLELTTAKQTTIQQSLFKQETVKKQSQVLREQGWTTALEQWPFLGKDMTEALLG